MVVEAGFREARYRQRGRHLGQIKPGFMLANFPVDMVQDINVQLLFIAEVIHHHALGGLRVFGDLLHTCPLQAKFGKGGQRAGEDTFF